ncbi:MAG: hypothetical protein ATN35_02075 [Epulopiscium sp. Nele67-Bin004]|nr:MAG: hypothetical protein ATN35_02075 [Epulopiscium sp. Nele67-Bin004]
MVIGERLKQIRKSKNLTAQQVADKLNMSQSNLSRLENSQRSISTDVLVLILSAYNITLDEFLNPNKSTAYVELVAELKYLDDNQLKSITHLIKTFSQS